MAVVNVEDLYSTAVESIIDVQGIIGLQRAAGCVANSSNDI
jgi:hypothetical protein